MNNVAAVVWERVGKWWQSWLWCALTSPLPLCVCVCSCVCVFFVCYIVGVHVKRNMAWCVYVCVCWGGGLLWQPWPVVIEVMDAVGFKLRPESKIFFWMWHQCSFTDFITVFLYWKNEKIKVSFKRIFSSIPLFHYTVLLFINDYQHQLNSPCPNFLHFWESPLTHAPRMALQILLILCL